MQKEYELMHKCSPTEETKSKARNTSRNKICNNLYHYTAPEPKTSQKYLYHPNDTLLDLYEGEGNISVKIINEMRIAAEVLISATCVTIGNMVDLI